jgi:hypothetical protein
MKYTTGLILLLTILSPAAELELDWRIIQQAPRIDAERYRCDDMVRVVNSLRAAGKEKALEALRRYIRESDFAEQKRVFLICRLLFVNPNGWQAPVLGVPAPEVNATVMGQYRLFPIAVSDGVPFLLTYGYAASGVGDLPSDCVKSCETFTLISADLRQTNYEAAARSLIQSETFQQLYKDSSDRERVSRAILRQALMKKIE